MTTRTENMLAAMPKRSRFFFREMVKLLDKRITENAYYILEGMRSQAVQDAYYAQGRNGIETVNKLRTLAGLDRLLTHNSNVIITNKKVSVHTLGLAMDIVPTDSLNKPTMDYVHYNTMFNLIAECARDVDIECGADWDDIDYCHYQVKEIS